MSQHTQAAKAVADALQAGANLRDLADALMVAIAPATSGVIDVGPSEWLVILPGYGPLSDPADFFQVLNVV